MIFKLQYKYTMVIQYEKLINHIILRHVTQFRLENLNITIDLLPS